jgi:hypothetical protein
MGAVLSIANGAARCASCVAGNNNGNRNRYGDVTGRTPAAALSDDGQELGRGELRQQSLPRFGSTVEGLERVAE